MATNKNALLRYKILDNCFRNTGRRYFIEDLIGECNKVLIELDPESDGIKRRQILQDISFMESSEGWQIELARSREGKRVYYFYTDPSFSINNMPLNEVEIEQLTSAIHILSQFRGMPQFEWINELLPKLRQGIKQNERQPIMDFDSNPYLTGIEHLGELYNAILYKKVLTIDYQPFENDKSYEVTLHPYFLKQYNNRWFLFGYNPATESSTWNLAIDRIKAIRVNSLSYKENSSIDWNEYFDDFVGVTRPEEGKLEHIILHFFGRTGKYMETKPLHASQKSKWTDQNTLEVSLDVMINYELERLILSYAESVRVIAPEIFRSRICKRIALAYDSYGI